VIVKGSSPVGDEVDVGLGSDPRQTGRETDDRIGKSVDIEIGHPAGKPVQVHSGNASFPHIPLTSNSLQTMVSVCCLEREATMARINILKQNQSR
jgi:hypothetical protein